MSGGRDRTRADLYHPVSVAPLHAAPPRGLQASCCSRRVHDHAATCWAGQHRPVTRGTTFLAQRTGAQHAVPPPARCWPRAHRRVAGGPASSAATQTCVSDVPGWRASLGVDDTLLDPRTPPPPRTWSDPEAYDSQGAGSWCRLFAGQTSRNMCPFIDAPDVKAAGTSRDTPDIHPAAAGPRSRPRIRTADWSGQ